MNNEYQEYFQQLYDKLKKGQQEYGNISFSRPGLSLIVEIQEECIDIAGWGYILWKKLENLKEKAKQIES